MSDNLDLTALNQHVDLDRRAATVGADEIQLAARAAELERAEQDLAAGWTAVGKERERQQAGLCAAWSLSLVLGVALLATVALTWWERGQ